MKKTYLAIASILLVASFASAHGNEQHVIGTVSKVTESSITVTKTDGKSVEVARGDAVLAEFGCRGCTDSLAFFRGLLS